MAIQEFDAQPSLHEAIPPLELFKQELHGMVLDLEDIGISALPALIEVREDLRSTQKELMKQSGLTEQQMREQPELSDELLQRWAELQENSIINYHKQVWTEGYIQDRQPSQMPLH